jgi:exodeoxyribonuclease-1
MTASDATFLWHDYETSGADPRRDRPLQFAAWRTGMDLEPVAEPVVLWCAPPRDRLPSPEAGLVTGLVPQELAATGLAEAAFAAAVHAQLAEPGTCAAGWNSIRFDDEFGRNLLYRNFFDPYAREWEHGNSRWDLIDLARLCYALRPDGLQWPSREDGAPSFRLEDLARANGLAHRKAHDALGDVEATLALARLLKQRQPRLFDWHFGLRQKRRALELLDWVGMTPVLHASQRYPAQRGCLAMVVPLAEHPVNRNGVIVYDLAVPPDDLIALDAEALADRVFTARAGQPQPGAGAAAHARRRRHRPHRPRRRHLRAPPGADPRGRRAARQGARGVRRRGPRSRPGRGSGTRAVWRLPARWRPTTAAARAGHPARSARHGGLPVRRSSLS